MSQKKRDTMQSAAPTGVNPSPAATALNGQALVLSSVTTNSSAFGIHMLAFSPSVRNLIPNNYAYVAARTATRTYVKGISETYRLVPSDASCWEWRRIVCSIKGGFGRSNSDIELIGAQYSTNPTQRYLKDITGDTTGPYTQMWDAVQDILFRGVKTTDWTDQMTAPVDTARVTLHSDKRRTLFSSNDAPRPRLVKTYVPINKTIQYDDEENGISITPSKFAVESKIGIGDIYIFDMLTCRAPISATTSQLQVVSTQTYYWHEK